MTQRDDPGSDVDSGSDASGLASVVLIDRREDIAAICGRVDTAPTFAVVIHAPDGNRQLSTELGMRRLARHAEEAGKVVAIATTSVELGSRARQVGIPVSRRPEHVRWDSGGRRVLRLGGRSFAPPSLGRYVQLLVIGAVALAFVGLALTMAPSADVVVYPPVETLSQVVTVTASKSRDTVDTNSLQVPARDVSAKRTVTLAVHTSGKVNVGTVAAKVGVTITNPGTAVVTVPAGTVVQAGADGPGFSLDGEAKVVAGGTLEGVATAVKAGAAGNVPAGTITAWADAKYRGLQVTNAEPAGGGLNEERPAVDGRDVTAIKALAESLAKSETLKQGLVEARPHDAVFLRTAETTITYGEPSAVAGTLADFLLLDVSVEIKAMAVVESTLNEVARAVLRPKGGAGEFLPGSVTAVETGARQVDKESGEIRTELRLQGEFARNLTGQALKEAVKGRSPGAAKSTLAERYGIQDSEVSVSPGWAPWLPRFDFRISVEMKTRPAETGRVEPGKNDASPTPTRAAAANPGP